MKNNYSGRAELDRLKESGLTYEDYSAIDDGNRYELLLIIWN